MKPLSSRSALLALLAVASACSDLAPPSAGLDSAHSESGAASTLPRGGSSTKKSSGGNQNGAATSGGRAATVTAERGGVASSSGGAANSNGGRATHAGGVATSGNGSATSGNGSATSGNGGRATHSGGLASSGGENAIAGDAGFAAGGSQSMKDTAPAGRSGAGGAVERLRPRPPFFSEYVEGSGNNKALELSVAESGRLDGCSIRIFANGSLSASRSITLTGQLTPEEPLVICSPQLAALGGVYCTFSESLPFNGNDVVLLACDGEVFDVIGQLGNDPGDSGWGVAALRTQDQTLRRACSTAEGDREPNDAFDPLANGWLAAGTDAFDGLGIRCEPIVEGGAGGTSSGVGGAGGVGPAGTAGVGGAD